MPLRKIIFANGEYYHIFNRGVNKAAIYNTQRDYKRFLNGVSYYQLEGPKPKLSDYSPSLKELDLDKKIVEVIAYCLMPNHFHLLLKQVNDKGVSEFIRKLCDSYTKYFNTKNNRIGPLFQGEFKSVLIESNEQLLHISRYIHLNPLISNLTNDLSTYPWSSYNQYLSNNKSGVQCAKEIILGQFRTTQEYNQFIHDQESYARELDFIQHQLIDLEY